MPYISKQAQYEITTGRRAAATAGELNFVLTLVVNSFVRDTGLGYQALNDVVGALEGAKAEFQRRIVAPYEESKMAVNGDVYPSDLTIGVGPEPEHSACGTADCCGQCPSASPGGPSSGCC